MPLPDISVTNVSKRYKIPRSRWDGAEPLLTTLFHRTKEICAIKNVSFEVLQGEAIGIVGYNGAGKSTLVKLLSGITVPTQGRIAVRGTLSAVLEVGAGFHLELTGRENVFLAGSVLGMSRREIVCKMDSILEFAGIGDHIDASVKTYSSGQFVRLGFAIAAQLESDIILLDEVLAVGDVAFQARCFDRLDRLRREGKTIVLISHDLSAIERVCDRAILLNRGELVMTGSPRDIVQEYSRTAYASMSWSSESSVAAKISRVSFECPVGGPVRTGEPMVAYVSFQLKAPVRDPTVIISFYWPSGYLCTQMTSAGLCHDQTLQGTLSLEFICPLLIMQRGLYRVDISMERGDEAIGHWHCCSLLRIEHGKIIPGDFYLDHSCSMSAGQLTDSTTRNRGTSPHRTQGAGYF
jgi:ABC-type polysaccharide/polyol phosphate transport system ATPase subunit